MSAQFKRRYELFINDGSKTKRINELRVQFDITKSILSYPNLAKIDIFNANNETFSMLQQKFTKISFKVGYQDNLKLIFIGDIRNVFQSKKGVDSIITIYAGDGQKAWQNATINKTFSEHVTVKTAINEVFDTFTNVSKGVIEGLPNVASNLRGQTLSGKSSVILDELANEHGFNWNIQNDEFFTTKDDEILSNDTAVLVRSDTGMLNSPVITELGINVTTLLNPTFEPNRSFKVESINSTAQLGNLFFREVKKTKGEGLYKVLEVNFKGDSHDTLWISHVKGRSL